MVVRNAHEKDAHPRRLQSRGACRDNAVVVLCRVEPDFAVDVLPRRVAPHHVVGRHPVCNNKCDALLVLAVESELSVGSVESFRSGRAA